MNSDKTILIADDHDISRKLLARSLASWGFDTICAIDGEDALRTMEETRVGIAIIDWMMPYMDGLDVCSAVRKNPNLSHVYIIMLSAKSRKEDVRAGIDAGADDYVIRPFAPDELRQRLRLAERVITLERMLDRAKLVETLHKVLVVSCDPGLRQSLVAKLSENNIGAAVCDGTAFALSALRKDDYGVAIVDFALHEVGPIEAIRCVRAATQLSYIFIIALAPSYNEQQMSLGDDFLIMPYDPDELRIRVNIGQRIAKLEQRRSRSG